MLRSSDDIIICSFRRFTQLPLDDCLYALKPAIATLTRSSLQRCLVRHGLSRLDNQRRSTPNTAPVLGNFFIYASKVPTDGGIWYAVTAFDQSTKFIYSRGYPVLQREDAASFLEMLASLLPYPIRQITTTDAAPFVPSATDRATDLPSVCRRHAIRHEIVAQQQLWHNDLSEDEALAESALHGRYRYPNCTDSAEYTKKWVHDYLFRFRLKALRGRTPHAHLCALWEQDPGLFRWNPAYLSLDASPSGADMGARPY